MNLVAAADVDGVVARRGPIGSDGVTIVQEAALDIYRRRTRNV